MPVAPLCINDSHHTEKDMAEVQAFHAHDDEFQVSLMNHSWGRKEGSRCIFVLFEGGGGDVSCWAVLGPPVILGFWILWELHDLNPE